MDPQLAKYYQERNALLGTGTPREIEEFFLDWQKKMEKKEKGPVWLSVLHEMGLFYRSVGQVDKSLQVLEKARKSLLRRGMEETGEYVSLLNALAGTCRQAGNRARAIVLLQEAIRIYGGLRQVQMGVCANLYSNLAQCCQETDQWELAAASLEKSLEYRQREGRKAELGLGWHNLALVYRQRGEKGKEAACVERALAQLDGWENGSDPRLVQVLSSLGGLLYQEGKGREAAEVYHRAARILCRTQGKTHAYAVSRQHEAWALRSAGDLEGACRALQEAETVCEGLYGRDNERVRAVLDELEQLLQQLKRKQGG